VSQEAYHFVSEVFYFLIKKELMFFTNGCPSSCHAGWGAPMYKLEKAIYSLKSKKLKMAMYNWKK